MATKAADKTEQDTTTAVPGHAPAPETVDHEAESNRLRDEDRERFERQGDKGEED